jgi:hypothetical protein
VLATILSADIIDATARAAELGDGPGASCLPSPLAASSVSASSRSLEVTTATGTPRLPKVFEKQRMPGTLAPVRRLGEAITLAWLALAFALAARAYRFNMSPTRATSSPDLRGMSEDPTPSRA